MAMPFDHAIGRRDLRKLADLALCAVMRSRVWARYSAGVHVHNSTHPLSTHYTLYGLEYGFRRNKA